MLVDKYSSDEKRAIETEIWKAQQILNEVYNKYHFSVSVACYASGDEVDSCYSCVFVHDDESQMILGTNSSKSIMGMLDGTWTKTVGGSEE